MKKTSGNLNFYGTSNTRIPEHKPEGSQIHSILVVRKKIFCKQLIQPAFEDSWRAEPALRAPARRHQRHAVSQTEMNT